MTEGVIFGLLIVGLLYISFNFLRGFIAGLREQK